MAAMLPYTLLMLAAGGEPRTTLGIQGTRFTINGQPTFLLGCSYYAGLGASDATITADLDDLHAAGFNWIRVWVTWAAFEHDVSAVDRQGNLRQPYLNRLLHLLAECDRRGMIVDVTFSRGDSLFGPQGQPLDAQTDWPHLRAVRGIAEAIRPWRNAYLDLGNERNIRDNRYVSYEELGALAAGVRAVDPGRLITASHAGGELSREELGRYLNVAKVDFLSPHAPRSTESAERNEARTQELLGWLRELGRPVPVHYQEPFRRGFSGGWEPTVDDFLTDLRGAVRGGAAGWCFHNGSVRNAEGDGRPRRSFDLRDAEGRLFDQLDEVEREVIRRAAEVVRGADRR